MPAQDAQGRWLSDDGTQYWDGSAWRPIGVQAAPRRRSIALPAVLIGCGFALLVVLVLVIAGVVLMSNPDMQRAFCNGYTSGDSNLTCPFNPPSP